MRLLRYSNLAVLILFLFLDLTFDSILNRILLYSILGISLILLIILAPNPGNIGARNLILFGFLFWIMGSILASLADILNFPPDFLELLNFMYLMFYPFMLLGIPQFLGIHNTHKLLDTLDALIVSLGLTSLGTALVLEPVLPHFNGELSKTFFALAFPIADLILVAVVITAFAMQGYSRRGFLITLGICIYALSDFLFLWLSINPIYSIESLIDVGWIFGLLLIAESFWFPGKDSTIKVGASPILITIAVFLSASLLTVIALVPNYFPKFILVPAILTLGLAFMRMGIALNQARQIGQERLLARTDELTGLPNRRRLISEIDSFLSKEGALLLLDLDGFKPINDRYGHEIGDKVLQQVALRFDRALPDKSLLARLGGDEFGVLIEGTQESAVEVALALRATLSYPFHIDSNEILLGVSIGVAKNNGDANLLKRADSAMYSAKREGLGVYQL